MQQKASFGPQPVLKVHPHFTEFMRLFDAMRVESTRSGGKMNYRALHRSILAIDPTIKYTTVFRFFKRLGDPFKVAQTIARRDLREKMKKIANYTLDEILKDPSLLSARDRVALAKIASQEELQEIKILLDEKHKQKQDNRLDFLIDQARYGDAPLPLLDAKTQDLALPDPNES